jgi:hypothetical protein
MNKTVTKNSVRDKGIFKEVISLSHSGDCINKTVYTKNVDGKEFKYIKGEATNNKNDKDDERLAKSFIQKIASTAVGLNVFSSHQYTIQDTLGVIEKTHDLGDSTIFDLKLEPESDNELVKTIFKKMENGINFGLSIGGKITKARKVFDESAGRWIKELLDGEIWEVSLTPMPAGSVAPVQGIKKSLDSIFGETEQAEDYEDVSEYEEDEKAEIIKTIVEMVQNDEIKRMIHDLFWAWDDACWKIERDDSLSGDEKAQKMNNVKEEFVNGFRSLAETYANNTAIIENQLS